MNLRPHYHSLVTKTVHILFLSFFWLRGEPCSLGAKLSGVPEPDLGGFEFPVMVPPLAGPGGSPWPGMSPSMESMMSCQPCPAGWDLAPTDHSPSGSITGSWTIVASGVCQRGDFCSFSLLLLVLSKEKRIGRYRYWYQYRYRYIDWWSSG